MRTFPALEICWPAAPDSDTLDHLLALLDDASPAAVEDQPLGVRVFFAAESDRDAAAALVIQEVPAATVTSLAVPDDNWAERSQASLHPVQIGGIIVAPPWAADPSRLRDADAPGDEPPAPDNPHPAADSREPHAAGTPHHAATIVIVIQPSMGFGTGHHPSTRLCLALLQRHVPTGGAVIDIGTGSGVLAIAAWRLGAASVIGVDVDRDALIAAAENVERNGARDAVTLEPIDITRDSTVLPRRFDLAFANITGAMLERHAADVVATVDSGGTIIASGFQSHERDTVRAAFQAAGAAPVDSEDEDGWVGMAFRRT